MRARNEANLRKEVSRWDGMVFCALFLAATCYHAFALAWTWEFHQRFFVFFATAFCLAAAVWLGLWRKFGILDVADGAPGVKRAHWWDWIFRGFWFGFFIAMVIAFNEGTR